jgi:hypothetical protein
VIFTAGFSKTNSMVSALPFTVRSILIELSDISMTFPVAFIFADLTTFVFAESTLVLSITGLSAANAKADKRKATQTMYTKALFIAINLRNLYGRSVLQLVCHTGHSA